jgi:putative ABC transport system permease protein
MFVILLATANGAQNGIEIVFAKRASNIIQLQGRYTSIPYEGLPDNRKIKLDKKDFDRVNNRFSEKEYLSALIPVNVTMSHAENNTFGNCTGIYPDYSKINGIKITDGQGRLIDDLDMKEKRKVILINNRLKDVLYKHEDPIGKTLLVNNLKFMVIGVFTENSIIDIEKAYIPFSTAQLLFNGGWGFNSLAFIVDNLNTNAENESLNDRLVQNMADIHRFDPDDKFAVNLTNQLRTYLQTISIINTIVIFIWVIGAGTLFAGMIGISNIMLITVRERTKEFGIRKALGAKPSSILKGIIMEAVFITSAFGYLGLFLGICVSGMFGLYIKNHPESGKFAIFENPSVNIHIAIIAMVVLIIVGVLAGYFPARQAVRIMPVEAMREE